MPNILRSARKAIHRFRRWGENEISQVRRPGQVMSVVEADERQRFHPSVLSASLQLPLARAGFFYEPCLTPTDLAQQRLAVRDLA